MNNDLLYQIALTKVAHIGDVHARTLINHFKDAPSIFNASRKELERIDGIGTIRANAVKSFRDFESCEKEIHFIEKNKIVPLCINDPNYPQRLLRSIDCPTLLYYKGNTNLNESKIISIVGTRNNSEYGKSICEKLIEDLSKENIIIVSGLAYGIDTISHQAALKNGLPTIGILAHGLDRIYPPQNKNLAIQMIQHGGLLTDFTSGEAPNKQNFPRRNRITAGICDALIVVETGKTGGSLITAEIANSYNKDVFAMPGRINDAKSIGCNHLIKTNKACLITDANDILEMMKWNTTSAKIFKKQTSLFHSFTENEEKIFNVLKTEPAINYDALYSKTLLSNSDIANALLTLEMNGIITALPGKRYRLSN